LQAPVIGMAQSGSYFQRDFASGHDALPYRRERYRTLSHRRLCHRWPCQ
jgi:hypothetical protein